MGGLSIILPTYNERENLPILLERISKACKRIRYEMIVVDDNSPDGTASIARNLKRKYKNLRIFVRKKKKGLASAIYFGIEKSKNNLVCVMDADLQHPPEIIPKMYQILERGGIDLVIASRFLKNSKLVNFPFYRYFLSKTAIFFIRSIFPKTKNIRDPLSGFFILKKKA